MPPDGMQHACQLPEREGGGESERGALILRENMDDTIYSDFMFLFYELCKNNLKYEISHGRTLCSAIM